MNEQDVIAKTQKLIQNSNMIYTKGQVKNSNVTASSPVTQDKNVKQWLETLPKLEKKSFLIDLHYENKFVVFCVKELDWQTSMNIDMKSFKANVDDSDYYSEEYERRHTLSKAILWVAEYSENTLIENNDELILEKLKYDIVDILWSKYKAITSVTAREAQLIYESTKKYLSGEAQEGVPIPAIVPTTIAICDGWCTLSFNELKEITAGDWERMQIIKMARTDLMGIYQDWQATNSATTQDKPESFAKTSAFDTESLKRTYPIGHPERPR
jgi:hypothetical protein